MAGQKPRATTTSRRRVGPKAVSVIAALGLASGVGGGLAVSNLIEQAGKSQPKPKVTGVARAPIVRRLLKPGRTVDYAYDPVVRNFVSGSGDATSVVGTRKEGAGRLIRVQSLGKTALVSVRINRGQKPTILVNGEDHFATTDPKTASRRERDGYKPEQFKISLSNSQTELYNLGLPGEVSELMLVAPQKRGVTQLGFVSGDARGTVAGFGEHIVFEPGIAELQDR